MEKQHIHPYHQRLLRAIAIRVYHGVYPLSGIPMAIDIHKLVIGALNSGGKEFARKEKLFVDYLTIEVDRSKNIGGKPQNRFDILFGEGKTIRTNVIGIGNDLIKCLNAICCLTKVENYLPTNRFPLYNSYYSFTNENPIPTSVSKVLVDEKKVRPFGFYNKSLNKVEKNIANEIERAVEVRTEVIFKSLSTGSTFIKHKKASPKRINISKVKLEEKKIDPENSMKPFIDSENEEFVCFRSSTNGRFIHVYLVKILDSVNVQIKKLSVIKDKLDNYKGTTTIEETGVCIPLSAGRRLIQVYKNDSVKDLNGNREISSLSIFELDKRKREYRGFRLGYDWKTAPKLSVTRFYLISMKEIEKRNLKIGEMKNSMKTMLLNKLPFDIKVNHRSFTSIPFHPMLRYLPMRLGGVFDNAMTFYDGGNNDTLTLPDFSMLKIFYNAAKGAIAKPKDELDRADFSLAAEYLTKSIEHGLTGHIYNIEVHNKKYRTKHKDTKYFTFDIVYNLFSQITNGVEEVTGSAEESWKDEFSELRRRFDETKNYSDSSVLVDNEKSKETNWIYRVNKKGGIEDEELTNLLKSLFDYDIET
ncbi:MAG: hypothetical protein IPG55_12430 [Saprospiraceae bacterium]|nr:hypothetical protein [Candidatus Defluviibacterium haderslevense]MBK7244367.1 hypothetical protein [Candidatus Defluviibacterium haderslevense]